MDCMPFAKPSRAGARLFSDCWCWEPIDSLVTLRLAREQRVPVYVEPRVALDRLVPGGRHQGVVGLVAAKAYAEPEDILSAARAAGHTRCWWCRRMAWRIPITSGQFSEQPEATGVQGVFIPERRAVGLTSVVAKASAGAVDYIPVGRVANVSRWIERLQREGVWVYAFDAEAPQIVYTAGSSRANGTSSLAEREGCAPGVRAACDDVAHIPMLGKVSSLNVSASAAIVLYEALRQRREGVSGRREAADYRSFNIFP